MDRFRYRAFVSYSWADAKWGNWLHRQLETYRTPAALVGKQGALGPVPPRLHPLFKDREEEAAGASIGAAVENALGNSEFLIVICSPNSAKSKWVEREVAWFKTHRDPAKVLALIVDGEPGDALRECFPRALTHQITPDMAIGEAHADAPLAADARMTGDGKRRAKLKLAAAMLGVGLDELVNRDERRRTIRTRVVIAASLALALVMSGLAWVAVQARIEAEFQRNEADGLIEFMLTDLREKLEPVGRLDALDVVGARALDYYAAQKLSSLDADALGRRARALLLVGEISNLRGESDAALQAFTEAAETTAEQLARDPDNAQRVYDHAQSVFWVGYVAYTRGETEDAEAQFVEYKRLADRLLALDPDNPEWQMESSYAESNLGTMLFEQGRYQAAEPAFAESLQMVEAVVAGEDYDPGRQLELGMSIYWLGTVRGEIQLYDEALELHRREIGVYQRILAEDPNNTQAQWRAAVAWQHIGRLDLHAGMVEQAVDDSTKAVSAIQTLRRIEPDNTEWQETEVRALVGKANSDRYAGNLTNASRANQSANLLLTNMISADPTNTIWNVDLRSLVDLQKAELRLAEGDPQRSLALSSSVLSRLEDSEASAGGDIEKTKLVVQAQLVFGDSLAQLGETARARAAWQAALDTLVSVNSNLHPSFSRHRHNLLLRLGRRDQANRLSRDAARQGDRHPAWSAL